MKKFYIERSRNAFTLIELLIVLSISALLVSLIIIDYRSSQKRRNLDLAAEEIRSMIVKAYDMSLSPEDSDVGGYGVHFYPDNRRYILFKDSKVSGINNHQFDPSSGEAVGGDKFLRPEVTINNYKINGNILGTVVFPQNGPFFSDLVFDVPTRDDNIPYKKDTYFSGQQEGAEFNNGAATLSSISVILQYGSSQKQITTNLYTNTVNIINY